MQRINTSLMAAGALVLTVGALAFPMWNYEDRSGTTQAYAAASSVDTQWGPLTAQDRDLINRVRLAGLWEMPAGQQAIERAPTPEIKEAGDHLVNGHADLDRRVRDVAKKLNITLPNEPTPEQQGWLAQMDAAQGEEYKRTFAQLLRSAHGKIFPVIGKVRNETRNSLVRQLASDTNQTVLDHITMLEKTGGVDFDAIANAK